MKDQKKTNIKVGITVLIGFVLLVWVFGWAKNFSLVSNEKHLTIRFDNSAGLVTGDAVTLNGVKKGYVDGISIIRDSVEVMVVLDSDVDLRKDASFSIMMLDLMGGKKVEVNPGRNNSLIDYSAIQTGKYLGDISNAMSSLHSLEGDLVAIIGETKKTLTHVNKLLDDENLTSDLKESAANMKNLSGTLQRMLQKNEINVDQLLKNSTELTASAKEFIDGNKENISSTVSELREMISASKKMIDKMNAFTDEIKNKENNLGKVLYDDKMIADVKHTVKQLNELTQILIEQLKGDGVNVDANIF